MKKITKNNYYEAFNFYFTVDYGLDHGLQHRQQEYCCVMSSMQLVPKPLLKIRPKGRRTFLKLFRPSCPGSQLPPGNKNSTTAHCLKGMLGFPT
jgi:hypothetical protein